MGECMPVLSSACVLCLCQKKAGLGLCCFIQAVKSIYTHNMIQTEKSTSHTKPTHTPAKRMPCHVAPAAQCHCSATTHTNHKHTRG